ncbi:MAG: TonB-dependent receptor [Ponticaulis sp.]|nr:TonB-dependent receptor [Ponticaulis sp.]|tara:strand:- start:7497 stop:9533 length:2037 start_codon:yes stop_codon:yes gene_type:complete
MNRSTLRATLICGSVLCGLTSVAHAQESETAKELDTVQVWGTTVESDLLTLTEDQISLRQADHLSDLLRVVPGVDIGGTHSVNSRINIRGLDDRELDIYIDGALQTNYLYHHMGNLLINADILTAADIEVGANSLTHGGRGGAVRFRTKTAEDMLRGSDQPFGARLMASYNDNAQTAYSATGYGQIGETVDGLIYYNQVDRDNFKDGSGRDTIGSDGTTENLLAKFGFEPTDNQRIQLSYDKLDDSGDYTQRPDMGVLTNQAITGDILLPTDYTRETINLSYDLDLGDLFRLSATVYGNDLELTRDETNPNIRVQGGNTLKRATADNQGFNLIATSDLNWGPVVHGLTYGIQMFEQDLIFDPDLTASSDTLVKQSSENIALFIEDQISLTNYARIRPGVRVVNHEVKYLNTGETGSFDDVLFALAGEVEPMDGLRFLASYTDLFSGPELAEPFTGAGSTKIVNANLQPETGQNLEIGLRYATDFAGGQLGLGGNIFETTIDDFIGEVAVPGTTTGETQDANLGQLEVAGYEVSLNYAHGPWDFLLTHNSSDFDTSALNTASVSESFREVGDTSGYELSYFFESWNLSLAANGQFIESKTTSLGADKESYDVHNIMARWDDAFGVNGLSFIGGVDNVFDATYTSHASRLGATFHPVFGPLILNDVEPGRNVKLTVSKVF